MSVTIFLQLFLDTFFIALIIFDLEWVTKLPAIDPVDRKSNSIYCQVLKSVDMILFLVFLMSWLYVAGAFTYCWFGSTTTENFLCYANVIYESQWYTYPIDLQNCLRLFVANAQRPRVFQGIGMIDLNLMAFAKVRMLPEIPFIDHTERLLHSNFR